MQLSMIFKGDVQGVGFRATAKRYADKLHLKGFVRNLPNGDVECCAQGEKEQLDKFLSELKRTFSAHLHEVVCDYRPVTHPYPDFRTA